MKQSRPITGGIHPDSTVTILKERKGERVTIPISELKPGNFLASSFDQYYWEVNEVMQYRRRLSAYRITLECGTSITLAENTWVCGQYGPTLIEKSTADALCLIDLSFRDTLGSRRRFSAHLKNEDKASDRLKRLFNVGHAKWHNNTKTFYYFNGLLRLLAKVREASPKTNCVWGSSVRHPYGAGRYSLRSKYPDAVTLFFPLVPLTLLHSGNSNYPLAFLGRHESGHDYDLTYSKVASVERIVSDGPWFFPVFDTHNLISDETEPWEDSVKQKFIFPVNDIPVFVPNAWFDYNWAKLTLPVNGEPVFPEVIPEPKKYSLTDIYESLYDQTGRREKTSQAGKTATIDSVWASLKAAAEFGVDDDELCQQLTKMYLAFEADITRTSKKH